ncbi:hypothetical protein [Enhygromyxa salina]|uniref:Uncharacterized protein n=1 Tax=Enhygromyxa salina TaxID=215803 RepID=A0A2S9YBZ9_9BACT|nr:hypothetical protein [Enhygromyxa salina]PRQ02630.1 hypothetical protein ENSA7_54590 [Enhygromyxa salina]
MLNRVDTGINDMAVEEFVMNKVQMHANRALRPRALSSGDTRGLPNYYSFPHGQHPVWWTEQLEAGFPDAFAVYENVPESGAKALVIMSTSVCVLDEDLTVGLCVEYSSIESFGRLAKEPVPEVICIRLSSGTEAELPVLGKTGAIVDWLRFLQNAVDAVKGI